MALHRGTAMSARALTGRTHIMAQWATCRRGRAQAGPDCELSCALLPPTAAATFPSEVDTCSSFHDGARHPDGPWERAAALHMVQPPLAGGRSREAGG